MRGQTAGTDTTRRPVPCHKYVYVEAIMGKYYLAVNYGCEGWSLMEEESIEEIIEAIKSGETHGSEFKVFKELDITLCD